jgi:hypothetical protein
VPVAKPVIVMENVPVPPLTSLTQVPVAIVGLVIVFQQTPLFVTFAPPSDVTYPPLVAVEVVIPLIMVVSTVGTIGAANVVNDKSLPYPVPTALVAKALTWYVAAAVRPVMELVNEPVPEPLCVHESAVLGLAVVLKQTPLSVTVAPPSDVTLPPPAAVVIVIPVIAAVVTVGTIGAAMVANKTSLPYPVPAELMAYALTWYVVRGVKPEMELINVPGPVLLCVQVLAVVGLAPIPQHTPLSVIDAPPSAVTLPPLVAAICDIPVIAVVVTVGRFAVDENCTSLP